MPTFRPISPMFCRSFLEEEHLVSDAHDHSNHVNKWMTQAAAEDLSPEQLLQLFEQAMNALWNRAHLTLRDATLTAIMDRVLYNASERTPKHLGRTFGSLILAPSCGSRVLNRRRIVPRLGFIFLRFLSNLPMFLSRHFNQNVGWLAECRIVRSQRIKPDAADF